MSETVLVTGAGAGLGLEFVRQYAVLGWNVIATYRAERPPEALQALVSRNSHIRAERMDVTQPETVARLARALKDAPIDVLINNAGVSGDEAHDFTKQNFGNYDFDLMDRILATNVRGPLVVSQSFAEHLQRGKHKKLVCISSSLGSLTSPFVTKEGRQATFYAASKAALNRVMQIVARTLKQSDVCVLLIHPGTVRTERIDAFVRQNGAPLASASFMTPASSVRMMIETIENSTLKDTGRFLQYDGVGLGW